MPVPSLVTDLSTTAASNSPAGSDNVFPDLDNYLRALSAFLASIRDNSGNGWVSPYLPLTYSAGTANAVVYLNGSKVVTTGAGLTFDGTNFATTGTASATKLIPTGGSATGNGMYLPAANTLAFSTNGAEVARLDSSGNLGLGVTPSAWVGSGNMQISGNIAFTGGFNIASNAYYGSGAVFRYISSAVASSYSQASGAHFWYNAPSGTAGNAITFTQAMTLDASGNLLVGDTATAAYFDGRLNVAGRIHNKISAANESNYVWNQATSGDNQFFAFGTEAAYTARGTISYNRAGGLVAYNTTSDYRAKDIIGPVQDSGATIDALKVYEGVMKGATQSRPMLIAHEAQEHAPYAVSGEKDEVNEDGTPKFQQIDVSSLVPLLLAEIQSLRARVAALEAA